MGGDPKLWRSTNGYFLMGIFSIVVFYVNPKYRILNLAGRTTSCLTASSMILYLCTPENTVVLTFCGAVFKSLKFVSIRYFGSCVQNGYICLCICIATAHIVQNFVMWIKYWINYSMLYTRVRHAHYTLNATLQLFTFHFHCYVLSGCVYCNYHKTLSRPDCLYGQIFQVTLLNLRIVQGKQTETSSNNNSYNSPVI